MTQEQIESLNKHITEKVMGECYHESNSSFIHNTKVKCSKCRVLVSVTSGTNYNPFNYDYYTSWSAMGRLLEKLRGDEGKWEDFNRFILKTELDDTIFYSWWWREITPQSFALAVGKWSGWEPK